MYGLLITLSVIAAVILMIVVLLQASKGEGLAGIAGGPGGMGATFGTRRTADFLSKATWWLGGFILVTALVVNLFFLPGKTNSSERESIIQSSQQQTAVPTAPAIPEATPTETPSSDDNTSTGDDNN
jgi:preprotein translocase subunit SecG